MSDIMMLSKNYEKLPSTYKDKHFYCSRKYDGVPAVISKDSVLSRQGKHITSIKHIHNEVHTIIDELNAYLDGDNKVVSLVGEVYQKSTPFKTISGKVRDTKQQHPELIFKIFDVVLAQDVPYNKRYNFMRMLSSTQSCSAVYSICCGYLPTPAELENLMYTFTAGDDDTNPVEGVMLRYEESMYECKRSWGMLRFKPEPTIDLRIVDAVEGTGKLSGSIGAFICEDSSGVRFNVGAGKLPFNERALDCSYIGRIAEVKYMIDATYASLRQPTFQRYRDDKTEPDKYLGY